MTEAGDRITVTFAAVFLARLNNRVHPDHDRVIVQLEDGTHLMLPIGAQVEPLEDGGAS